MRRLQLMMFAALLTLALAGVSSSALARGGARPTVVSANCHGHSFKPGRIILACADAGLYVEHLQWQRWGRIEAEGTGTGTGRTCKPSCAAGGTRSGAMEIRLYAPKVCRQDGRVHFTKIKYRWSDGSPIAGTPDSGVVPSPCRAV
jgi:hypothetical protein